MLLEPPILTGSAARQRPDTGLMAGTETKALRLAVAAHFVCAGRVGGAEHMLYNLLRGLWHHRVPLDVLCADTGQLDPAFLAEARSQRTVRVLASGRRGPRFLTEQMTCLEQATEADAIIFPNYYVPPIVPRRLGAVICVLHDMQYRHIRANFSGRKRLWLRLAHYAAIRCCDRLIAISEFVRQDALRFLGERFAERVTVIPNPVSWERFGLPRYIGPAMSRPCIVSVAAQYEHKNLDTLLRAFALVLRRWPDARLVLCGQDFGSLRGVTGAPLNLAALAHSLGIADSVEVTGYVDDLALGRVLQRATVFAFPSIFEGFGMPPVEALGLGLPCLTTRMTALPEVTMGLAQYVERPRDVEEWADRLDAMIADPVRHGPGEANAARLRERYSPARIAGEYLAVSRQAAAG